MLAGAAIRVGGADRPVRLVECEEREPKGILHARSHLEAGEIGLHSTPTVVHDVVLVGSAMKEGMTVVTNNNTKGLVRAFDVKSGKLKWTFNTIPKPNEPGGDTWLNNSWSINGNTGPLGTPKTQRTPACSSARTIASLLFMMESNFCACANSSFES